MLATLHIFGSWATWHLGYNSHLLVLDYMASSLHVGSSALVIHGILATLRIFMLWDTWNLGYTSHLQVLDYMASWLHFVSSGLGLHGILAYTWDLGYMASSLHFASSCRSWATSRLGLHGITLRIFMSSATWHLGYTSQLHVLATLRSFMSWATSRLGQHLGYIVSWLLFASSCLVLHGILATLRIFRCWTTWHLVYTSHFQVLGYIMT